MANETVPPPYDSNEKTLSMITHILPLSNYILPGIALILVPLIWWILMKEKHPLVDMHGKEVLNFSISLFIYFAISGFLCIILIGIPLLIALGIAQLILVIIGAVKASEGKLYRYPLTIRFIS